jgi:hypothetical protein
MFEDHEPFGHGAIVDFRLSIVDWAVTAGAGRWFVRPVDTEVDGYRFAG